ncbi:hypothetical protein Ocin01_13584 [Orchesella cincta]|uniref:Uncharacterized protein n=1 Tax=Orchesella cincta TaxID=48709 RepID=A0A1D2MJB2_ORCCI|nr:hypothetical protein Ocin01_13584 [Orchesella cincta]
MRCPSCNQLIYIYELIQLFPVESGGASVMEQLSSATFQQKLIRVMGQLENLMKDLDKKNSEVGSIKGNETPTKLQRLRDSPKRAHANQIAELMKGVESLKGSIAELNSLMEQNVELGSVLEKQSQEISELKSKNEELVLSNETLKGREVASDSSKDDSVQKIEQLENVQTTHAEDINATNAAQDLKSSSSVTLRLTPAIRNADASLKSSPASNEKRKSVTFMDPFDEFRNERQETMNNIPLEIRDFKLGDKVVWYFEGCPEVGTVKWKGFVGSRINVGVEFERQLGLPIKDHSSDALQCIFKSKPGHGRLIPVNELILYDKTLFSNYYSNANDSKSSERVHCEYKDGGDSGKRLQLCRHQ